jgi:hypothetical protein
MTGTRLGLNSGITGARAVRRVVALTALSVFLVLQEVPAEATPVLDQSFTSGDDLVAIINEGCKFVAQTFTAGLTGTLSGINIDVASYNSQVSYPLRVTIRTVRHRRPTSTVLGVVALRRNNAPLSRLITFPQAIEVSAGAKYAIVVNYKGAPPPGPGQGLGYWRGATGDAYPRGMLLSGGPCIGDSLFWHTYPAYDVHFRTYVEAAAA